MFCTKLLFSFSYVAKDAFYVGYHPKTGKPAEAFFRVRGGKSGTLLDGLLYDAGVLLSLALQYVTPATALAKSVARLEDDSPASPVGALIDEIVKEADNSPSNQCPDVSSMESVDKEREGELFAG